MRLSAYGLNLIKGFEGLRLEAYKPIESEKYFTIGYGHYGADVRQGEKITQEQATSLLEKDLEGFEACVNSHVHVPLNQNQYDALVSFCYNVGQSAFSTSTLLELLNEKNYQGASLEFPLWVHDGGKVIQGLVTRRKAEQELFNKPVIVESERNTTYVIKKGDTFWDLEEQNKWQHGILEKLNPHVIPERLQIGQVINIP